MTGDDETSHEPARQAERAAEAYGSAVRTALRNNATAYGFSVSITAAYGLVAATHGATASALPTVSFALGSVAAFILVGLTVARRFRLRALSEDQLTTAISGAVDVLAVLAAVGVAVALARIPGTAAWSLTALGTTVTFLLVGGVDVLIARRAARGGE